MKKQLLKKTFTAIFILAVSACFLNLQGQVSISFANDSADIGGGSTGTISPLTLHFSIDDVGKISLDAFSGNPDSLVMAVVDRWDSDSVGMTDVESIFGYSFSLVATVVDGGDRLQSRLSYGGGLGVRGKNQWRIDDSGTEFIHFQLLGEVGLEFTQIAYNSANNGAYGTPNLRFIDYDSDKTYLIEKPVANDTVFDLPDGDLSMRHSFDSLTVTTSDTLTGGDGNEGGCLYGLSFNVVAAQPKVLPPGQISVDFFNAIEKDVGNTATGGLDKLTLDFAIDAAGKISMDATTENDNADVVAVVNAWDNDNVGSTDNSTLYNKSFSLIATTSDRIQCDAEGGLGVQGRNQWRFDDAGTEFIYFELAGEVGLEFVSMKYNSLNGGSSDIPRGVGNLRFIDYDSDNTYYLKQPELSPFSEYIFPEGDVVLRYKTDVVTVTTSDTLSLISDGGEGARLYGLVLNVTEPVHKPPAVFSTTPAESDTLVPVTADYVIVFDNPMNEAVSEAAVSISPDVSNRVNTWDDEGIVLTISFDDLSFYTQYTVTVGSGVQGANELFALGDSTFTFQTLPDAPTVVDTYPVDQAENVPAGSPLIIEFIRSMNRDSVENAISIAPAVDTMMFSWNGTSTKLVISTEMETSTDYTVTINTNATDAYGVTLAESVGFSFKTAVAVSVDNKKYQDVKLYPNPITDVLYIRGMDVSTVNIYSLTGRLVKTDFNSTEINLGDVKPGSYIVAISDREGNKIRKMIVKR